MGNPGPCGSTNNNGTFTYQLLSLNTIYGNPGITLAIDARLVNNSTNNTLVLLRRMQNDTAQGWATSMCADVCYNTDIDTATILIAPGDTQDFHMYFYTNAAGPDSSHVRMRFRNVNNSNNVYTADYYGITNNLSGINEATLQQNSIWLFPVPAKDYLFVSTNFAASKFILTDITGKIVLCTGKSPIDIRNLDEGLYFLKAYGENGQSSSTTRFIKTN